MDPIALAILASKHDLLDKTVDFAIEHQCLPHMGRMLQNEALTDAQEDRVLTWLEQSFWAAAGMDHLTATGERIDVVKHRAVAVEGSETTGWQYLYADIVEQGGQKYLAHRVTTVSDAVTAQTSDLLFGHPRAPQYLRDAFKHRTYSIVQDGLASTVLRLKNPAWTADELAGLVDDTLSGAWSRMMNNGKQKDLDYAYDVAEALRDHPSAGEYVQERAEEMMVALRKRAEEKKLHVPRGAAAWQPSALGLPLPEYR